MPKYKVTVRKYSKPDHEQVCRMFYSGVMEAWLPSYRSLSPTSTQSKSSGE